ncbi:tetratricopeptide repeat protein [Acidobacteriota bacterium]
MGTKKILSFISVLGFILVLVSPAYEAAFQQSAEELYESALFKKDVDGDLNGAIELFKKILAQFPDNRKIAAKAQLQIGLCYEKMGLQEAQKAFKKVIDSYPEQAEAVKIAQKKLDLLARITAEKSAQEFIIRKVWAGNDVESSGKISPDGRYLSLVDWGTGNLGVRDMSTGKNRNITTNGSWKTDAMESVVNSVWSSDGKQLAYSWTKDSIGMIELYIVNLDGSGSRLLLQKEYQKNWITPLDWSPDGMNVLVLLAEGRHDQLALISVKDSSIHILNAFEAVDIVPRRAEFSPDGRFIVFGYSQNKTDKEQNISIITSDGKQETHLVNHPADDLLMGWSPDGKWILFMSDRTGAWDAWIIPISEGSPAGEPMLVNRGIGLVHPMGFSTNGSFYYSTRGGRFDVFSAKIDPETGRVTEAPKKEPLPYEGFNTYPEWSPDGRHLVYISMRGRGERTLCLYNDDTGRVREIDLEGKFVYFSKPKWGQDNHSIVLPAEVGERRRKGIYKVDIQTNDVSPIILLEQGDSFDTIWSRVFTQDGKSLFYIYQKETGGVYRIIERDLQTGEDRILLETPPNANNMLSLSPDGKQLALILVEEKNMRMLKVMPVEGGEPKELHRFELAGIEIVPLDWAPDGRYIYFGKMVSEAWDEGWELWRISAEGGQAENLDLTMNSFISLNFHPDGKRITFASRMRDEITPEIWVMENFLTLIKKQ